MSSAFTINVRTDELAAFILSENSIGSNIPIRVFSVVNATMGRYNRTLGFTNGRGTFHTDGLFELTAYGCDNRWPPLMTVLQECGVNFRSC